MKKLPIILNDILALLAGAILTLSFAPFNIFPLAILSGALLLNVWLNSSTQRAFWRGWLFGVGLFSTGVYWVYISIHTYGGTNVFAATLITALLIAYISFFPALAGYLLNRFFPTNNNAKILLAFPAIWVFTEWVRSWLFTGFPWLLVGYSQMTSPLRGYAPIASVFGISLAVLFCSGLVLKIILEIKQKNYPQVYKFSVVLLLIWIIGGTLSLIAWTKPINKPIQISMVQGNIAQELKWSPEHVQPTLDHYEELTNSHWNSPIVIWPESAIPVPLQMATDFVESMAKLAYSHQTTFISGIPIKDENSDSYYNAVIAIGAGQGLYLKHRLVPFGEFIPFRKIFGRLFDLMQVPMSNFISGEGHPDPILSNGLKIAAFICYEIAYPEQVLWRQGDMNMILTISNDAWFGHSIAQAQHLQMAGMRALEMGRPVLFVSNDGITAFINAKGKIQSRAPAHEPYVLTDTIQATAGTTPWQRFGMDPVFIIIISFLGVAAIRRNEKDAKI